MITLPRLSSFLFSLMSAGWCLAAALEPPPGDVQGSPVAPLGGAPRLSTGLQRAPLPVDEAFALSVVVELPDAIVALWEIQDGYYLYRKSMEFTQLSGSPRLDPPAVPQGVMKTDEFFGESEVYFGRLLVRIPFSPGNGDKIELLVKYQGCAEIGYCYPLQERRVTLEF